MPDPDSAITCIQNEINSIRFVLKFITFEVFKNNNKEWIMLAKITVADYMTKHLVKLSQDMNVIDAIQKF